MSSGDQIENSVMITYSNCPDAIVIIQPIHVYHVGTINGMSYNFPIYKVFAMINGDSGVPGEGRSDHVIVIIYPTN